MSQMLDSFIFKMVKVRQHGANNYSLALPLLSNMFSLNQRGDQSHIHFVLTYFWMLCKLIKCVTDCTSRLAGEKQEPLPHLN